MNKVRPALLIALVITLSLLSYSQISKPKQRGQDVQGAATATAVPTSNENQAQRIPPVKINLDKMLIDMGKMLGLTIVEIVDTSYGWKTDTNTYEIVGKGITIPGASEDVINKTLEELSTRNFTKDNLNSYTEGNKDNVGYSLEEVVCLVRKHEIETQSAEGIPDITVNLELRCGIIDYSRVQN